MLFRAIGRDVLGPDAQDSIEAPRGYREPHNPEPFETACVEFLEEMAELQDAGSRMVLLNSDAQGGLCHNTAHYPTPGKEFGFFHYALQIHNGEVVPVLTPRTYSFHEKFTSSHVKERMAEKIRGSIFLPLPQVIVNSRCSTTMAGLAMLQQHILRNHPETVLT